VVLFKETENANLLVDPRPLGHNRTHSVTISFLRENISEPPRKPSAFARTGALICLFDTGHDLTGRKSMSASLPILERQQIPTTDGGANIGEITLGKISR
jgi:hypothetical protein